MVCFCLVFLTYSPDSKWEWRFLFLFIVNSSTPDNPWARRCSLNICRVHQHINEWANITMLWPDQILASAPVFPWWIFPTFSLSGCSKPQAFWPSLPSPSSPSSQYPGKHPHRQQRGLQAGTFLPPCLHTSREHRKFIPSPPPWRLMLPTSLFIPLVSTWRSLGSSWIFSIKYSTPHTISSITFFQLFFFPPWNAELDVVILTVWILFLSLVSAPSPPSQTRFYCFYLCSLHVFKPHILLP